MKLDLYDKITNSIIENLEKGTPPWKQPWIGNTMLPYSFKTGVEYQGINILQLWNAQNENNYSTQAWLTYKQAQEMGGNVKKGEKATQCIFYKQLDIKDKITDEEKSIPMIRPFWLFNLDQIEGIDGPSVDETERETEFTPVEAVECLVADTKVKLIHEGVRAFYQHDIDTITMPDTGRFNSTDDYYATLLHEIIHWTGHKTRLDRGRRSKHYGDNAYAFEELVAEIGSAFMFAEYGLQGDVQHSNYIGYWLNILKSDKRAIIKAASYASKAHHYLLEFKEQEQIEAA